MLGHSVKFHVFAGVHVAESPNDVHSVKEVPRVSPTW